MRILLLTHDIIRLKALLYPILFLSLSANVFSQAVDESSFWSDVRLENLELINTPMEEFSPHIWSNYLVYIGAQEKSGTNKKGPSYFDIKASLLNDQVDLKNFVFNPELNTPYHDGPISWDKGNNKIYFTRATVENEQPVVDSKGRQLLQIFQAEYAQGKWSELSKLSFCNQEENYCHPAIFNDGKSLVFASSIEGGSGKMDLYRTDKITNSTWSNPVNLGKRINNPGNDWFPFVYDDYLFYATDVKDGNGLDIYVSKINHNGKLSEVVRLPAPINSAYDDFGLAISSDAQVAYISSNRPGGKGKDDVYRIILSTTDNLVTESEEDLIIEEEVVEVKEDDKKSLTISINDRISKSVIPQANVTIFVLPNEVADNFVEQLNSNSNIELLESMARNIASSIDYQSDDNGKVAINIPNDTHLFLVIKKPGYLSEWNYKPASQPLSELGIEMKRN